jgi:putative peptidoglycan lipid II flippase
MGLILLIIRIYYAIHDTITPMKIAFIALPLNAGLSFILAQFMGAGGLALGTSISVIITSILGIYDLNKKLKLFETIKVTKDFFIIIIAAIVMAALIIIIKKNLGPILNDTLGQEIALLFLSVGAGISVYWTILNNFKILD